MAVEGAAERATCTVAPRTSAPTIDVLALTPGAGKTTATRRTMRRLGVGTLFAPTYELATELESGLKDLGCAPTMFRGKGQDLPEKQRKRLQAFQARAHAVSEWLRKRRRRRTVGRVCVGVHDHARVLPIEDEADDDSDDRVGRKNSPRIFRPLFVDECPGLVPKFDLGAQEIQQMTATYLDAGREAYVAPWRTLACLLVKTIRRVEEGPRPESHSCHVFGEALRDAALSVAVIEQYRDALAAAVKGEAGLPRPPIEEVLSGAIRARDWPSPCAELLLRAFAALVLGTSPGFTGPHRLSILIGAHKSFRTRVHLRYLWSLGLDDQIAPGLGRDGLFPSFVVLDATAHLQEAAYVAAFPAWRLQITRIDVRPDHPASVRRVYFQSCAYTRTRLLVRGRWRERACPAICRLLREAVAELRGVLGRQPRLAVIGPKAVANVVSAAHRVAFGAARRSDQRALVLNHAKGLVGELHHLFTGPEQLVIGHQNAVRGLDKMKDLDGIVCLPTWPDMVEVEEDAKFLGIDPSAYYQATAEAELYQELYRVRPLDASPERQVFLMCAGRARPSFWVNEDVTTILMGTGRLQGRPSMYAELLCRQAWSTLGVVSGGFLRWLLANPERFRPLGLEPPTAEVLELLGGADRKVFERAAREVAQNARTVSVPNPAGRGKWPLFEAQPGAAASLVRRLKNGRPDVSGDTTAMDPYSQQICPDSGPVPGGPTWPG